MMQPKNWYQECGDAIRAEFGSDAELFIDLLAATSPRKQVGANWRLAMRIYHVWQQRPDKQWLPKYVKYEHHKWVLSEVPEHKDWFDNMLKGVMKTHRPNVLRALRREPLSGNKVRAFAANLKGDLEQVTIDVWVCRYFGWKTTLSNKQYKHYADRIREWAARVGEEPAEYQAQVWCSAIRAAGWKPQSYQSVKDRNQMFFEFYWEV
jgi:hypothetical protein